MNNDILPVSPHPMQSLATSTPPEEPKKSALRDTLSTIAMLMLALLAAILINLFVFQSYEVDGQSMEPTLQNRDRLIIWKFDKTISAVTNKDYVPNRGDIIVFHKPNGSSEQLIKRVIGLPGERVVVKDGVITVYNSNNPQGIKPDDAPYGSTLEETYGNVDVNVGEKEVFVVGDNRIIGASLDSRSVLGNVPLEKIVGKLVFRYLPIGNVNSF